MDELMINYAHQKMIDYFLQQYLNQFLPLDNNENNNNNNNNNNNKNNNNNENNNNKTVDFIDNFKSNNKNENIKINNENEINKRKLIKELINKLNNLKEEKEKEIQFFEGRKEKIGLFTLINDISFSLFNIKDFDQKFYTSLSNQISSPLFSLSFVFILFYYFINFMYVI